jgi:hypothetical protein
LIYQAITTCNAELWAKYGGEMAATFDRYWPSEIPLRVYAEGFSGIGNERIEFVDLDTAAPWLAPWKAKRTKAQRGKDGPRYNYRLDAVRFAHKIAAIRAAAARMPAGHVLIWMDADIVTHAPVTMEWLAGLFPERADIAWLDRTGRYPECGFLMFRLMSAFGLIRDLVAAYKTGKIFRYPQTHDSYVIQEMVNAAVARGEIRVASLSGKARVCHHPFCAGPLGAVMDHRKGTNRKLRGKSFPTDLMGPRSEPYWQCP